MRTAVRGIGALLLAAAAASCGGVTTPSSGSADDFSGTLDPRGQATKPFSVSKTGEISLTIQSLTPRPVVGFLSMAIGTQSGTTCAPIIGYVVNQAAIGQVYSFLQIVKGSYCTIVADSSGILTASTAFVVRVNHP